jgi:hypothetical protein
MATLLNKELTMKIEELIRRREELLDTKPPACLRQDGVSKERRRAYDRMMRQQIAEVSAQIKSLREEQ